METREFQKMCAELVKKIDVKYNVERDPQLSFVQLTEEVGEIAKEINKPRLRHKEVDMENLEGEFSDVFLQLAILADTFDIDLEKAVESKTKILNERHGL
jgi:NTP pyrophosphatase (non-canonical NTP hydrolase)